MKQELLDRLHDKYPVLYSIIYAPRSVKQTYKISGKDFYCGDGWYGLLEVFSTLIVEREPNAVISEITRDEIGKLRVNMLTPLQKMDENYDFIFRLTEIASRMSEVVCEECGKYIQTCTEHQPNEKYKALLKNRNTQKLSDEMSRILYTLIIESYETNELTGGSQYLAVTADGTVKMELTGGDISPFVPGFSFFITYVNNIDIGTGEYLY